MFKQIKDHWIIVGLLILVICITVINSIFVLKNELNMLITSNSQPVSILLDFSNSTGYARTTASFTDLLVGSRGSSKKGEGYVVTLSTNNPSSNDLKSSRIVYSWFHNSQERSVTIADPNAVLVSGSELKHKAFLSPLEGDELKSIWVWADYKLVLIDR